MSNRGKGAVLMSSPQNDLGAKVVSIFRELVGDRAELLATLQGPAEARAKIKQTMCREYPERTADDIGFHLVDWNGNAAFLVALYLFPERFSPDEVREGIINTLVHAPNHMAAAAKLVGHPISDVFELGNLLEE